MGRGNPKSDRLRPALVESRIRAMTAVEQRISGKSFTSISKDLGYATRNGAFKAVQRLLERVEWESADQYRALKIKQLDQLQSDLAARLARPLPMDQQLQIVDRIMAVIHLQCKIGGLYPQEGGSAYAGVGEVGRAQHEQARLDFLQRIQGLAPEQGVAPETGASQSEGEPSGTGGVALLVAGSMGEAESVAPSGDVAGVAPPRGTRIWEDPQRS